MKQPAALLLPKGLFCRTKDGSCETVQVARPSTQLPLHVVKAKMETVFAGLCTGRKPSQASMV